MTGKYQLDYGCRVDPCLSPSMKLSLRSSIAIATLLGLSLPALIGWGLNLRHDLKLYEEELALVHRRYVDMLALGLREPLWTLAPESGKPLLDSLMNDQRIVRITVNDASLGTFLTVNLPERRQGRLYSQTHTIQKQGATVGSVTLEMDDGPGRAALKHAYLRHGLGILLQIAAGLALLLFLFHAHLIKPMRRLTQQSQNLAQGELDTPFQWEDDEIGKLGQNLEAAREALREQVNSLAQKNLKLETELISRKQIESALVANQNRYRHLVENTTVIPWDANPTEWRFTYVGPQAEKLLGYPTSVWYSEGFLTSYLHPDDRHLAYRLFTDFQQENNEFECRLLAPDGREVWVLLAAMSHVSDNGRRRLYGFLKEITERKHAEQEQEKYCNHLEEQLEARTRSLAATSHELEAFSYSVSHDLRTPLRTIDGFSQVLLEDYSDALDTNARHYLLRIHSAAAGMTNLIEDLINLSRLSRTELRRQPVNLSALAGEIAEELNALQTEHPPTLEIAPDMEANADPAMIRVVLHNLLDNAWKFSAGVPSPQVRFGVSQVNQQQVFFVSDNGIGLDMKEAGRLFSPFQRLHESSQYGEGSGIGLTIAQRIISRHEGHIWAKSAPNEGATFYFTLPAGKKTA